MLLQVVENSYKQLLFFSGWCCVMNEGYTGVPPHIILCRSSYKFASVLGCFGPQLFAGECRWQCVRRGDKLCQVFLPSGDSKREEGNKFFPEFPRYCPINMLIYPSNWLSMHFSMFVHLTVYFHRTFVDLNESTYHSPMTREAEGKEPLRKELLLELREGSLGSSLDE